MIFKLHHYVIIGLFDQSVGDVSDKFQVYITPAGFTFSIWSVIYIFLGAGAIYSNNTIQLHNLTKMLIIINFRPFFRLPDIQTRWRKSVCATTRHP